MTTRHHVKHFFIGLCVVLAGVATAATFNLFSPATGILKGNASTYVTTAAVSTDIIATFTGTCNNGTYLRGDGTCNTPPGSGVSSVGLTMPSGFSVGGSPVTSSGTLAVTTTLNGVLHGNGSGLTASNVLLGSEVTGTLPVGNGGTGAVTLTGILKGNGTSPFTAATSADVIGLWTGTCNSGTFLRADGACAAAGAGSVTSVGLTMPGVFTVGGSPVTTSGTLAVTANGTSGGVPYFNSTTTMASSAALTANQLVLGGGAGVAPAALGSLGTTTTVLHGNAGGAPTFGAVSLTADVTGTLGVGNGGTGVTSSTGSGSVVLSASPTLTGTVTAATIAATTVTVGGNNVCQSTGTNCPAGTGVKFAFAVLSGSVGGCPVAAGNSSQGISCSRIGTGAYNLTFSASFSAPPVCQVTGLLGGVAANISGNSTTTGSIAVADFAGTPTDAVINVLCVGL